MEQSKLMLNRFTSGVNTDIAEDMLPNTFLAGGHNIKFTNHDNKQGIVQKQESYIRQLDGYDSTLTPLAAQVFNDVIYIVSYGEDVAFVTDDNPRGSYTEIGTYPSADLGIDPITEQTTIRPKVYKYAPLPNYLQIPYVEPTGAFSETLITAATGEIIEVDITYDKGSNGLGWIIEKVDGSGNADAIITPQAGTTNETVTFEFIGDDADIAEFRLREILLAPTHPDAVLDTIDLEVNNGLGIVDIDSFGTIDYETIVVNATVVSHGGDPTGTRGICWGTSSNPTINDDFLEDTVAGSGSFNLTATGLTPGTLYHFRAYYDNVTGVSYSADETATAKALAAPTITTDTPIAITSTGATVNGTVTDDGHSTITEVGLVYSSSNATPTLSDSSVEGTLDVDDVTILAALTGLSNSTKYYVRTYATNTTGTGYGDVEEFTTLAGGSTPPSGSFSESLLSGNDYDSFTITVDYDQGGAGTGYYIARTGDASATAVFDPDTGTVTGSYSTDVVIRCKPNIVEGFTTYTLFEASDDSALATINIEVFNDGIPL